MIKSKTLFQQLPLLRNIICNKRAGTLLFRLKSGADVHSITITEKKVTGQDVSADLLLLFTKPMYSYRWDSKIKLTSDSFSYSLIPSICRSIGQVSWSPNRQHNLTKAFSLMPAIQVTNPQPEIAWQDMTTYQTLYRFTKTHQKPTPANFLASASDDKEEIRYLKVLMMAYCLGLISKPKPSKKSNIASRILKRIRKV